MARFGVVLFHTSSSAMQAEAALLKAKLNVRLVPTPRELSSDCGLSLRFDWNCSDEVQSYLEKARVEFAGIHPLLDGPK